MDDLDEKMGDLLRAADCGKLPRNEADWVYFVDSEIRSGEEIGEEDLNRIESMWEEGIRVISGFLN